MTRAVVLAVLVTACRAPVDCPSPEGWSDSNITVYSGSRLRGADLSFGSVARCRDDAAAAAFRSASRARVAMGTLAPERVAVHVDVGGVAIDRIETHADGVLVEDDTLPTGVWIHELTHVRIGRRRGPDGPGERLLAALEEGVADHVARVRGHGVNRPKLLGPPRASWAAIARRDLRFDPHPLGERFGWLLTDTTTSATISAAIIDVVGATESGGSVAPVVLALRAAGPESFVTALRRWLPPTLWPDE